MVDATTILKVTAIRLAKRHTGKTAHLAEQSIGRTAAVQAASIKPETGTGGAAGRLRQKGVFIHNKFQCFLNFEELACNSSHLANLTDEDLIALPRMVTGQDTAAMRRAKISETDRKSIIRFLSI